MIERTLKKCALVFVCALLPERARANAIKKKAYPR